MIINDTALIEQKIESLLNSSSKGYVSLDRHDYEIVSSGMKSMVAAEVTNMDFNETIVELKTDLAKLNPVDGNMMIWIRSSVLTMKQLCEFNELISEMEGVNSRKQAFLNEGDGYAVFIVICLK